MLGAIAKLAALVGKDVRMHITPEQVLLATAPAAA